MDKLTRAYVRIRDTIAEKQRQFDAELEQLKGDLDFLKTAMREHLQANNSTSMKTEFGLVVMSKRTRYWTNDWDQFNKFVIEHDALDLFERRIHQGNMAEFLAQNPEVIPPGLNADTTLDISVRKTR